MEGRRAARISISRPLPAGDPGEDADLRNWAVDTVLALNEAFRVPIRTLVPLQKPAEATGGEDAAGEALAIP